MKFFGIPYQRRQLHYVVGDVILALVAIHLGHAFIHGFGAPGQDGLSIVQKYTGASLFFFSSNLLMLYLADAYNPNLDFRERYHIPRLWVAVALAIPVQLVAYAVFPHGWWGRDIALLTALCLAILLSLWRPALCAFSPRPAFRLRTLVVGPGQAAHLLATVIRSHSRTNGVYDLVGLLDHPRAGYRRHGDHLDDDSITDPAMDVAVVGSVSALKALVAEHRIELVIVALRGSMGSEVTKQLLECKSAGVQIEEMATVYKRLTGKVPILHLTDSWLIFGPVFSGGSQFGAAVQRLVDITIAVIGALLTLPVVLLAMMAIRLESRGSPLFFQERLGRNERPFEIIKLRTMRLDAEKHGPKWSQGPHDNRVTKVGRFLRRTRIDEMPQFYNVLRGDMSIVGPRPERAYFVGLLKEKIPFYALRFSVKPGVTGWAQVRYGYGANEEDAAEKLCYELYAIQEMSPALYVLIVLKTIQTAVLRSGS